MKKLLVMIMLAGMVGWGGCTAESTSAVAGAMGLTATGRILEDLGNITDREKAIVLAQRVELLDELAVAKTESQRDKLEAQIKANDELGIAVDVASDATTLAKAAAGTKWSDPESAGPTIGLIAASAMAWWLRVGSKKKDKRLDAKTAEINKLRNGGTT